jgi:hypothetical protein
MAFEFPNLESVTSLGAGGVMVVPPPKVRNPWPKLSGANIAAIAAAAIAQLGSRQARRWRGMA